MARRRRKPHSPIAWLLGMTISVAGTYAVYQVSVASIEQLGKQRIAQAKEAQQRLQQKQQARQQLVAPEPTRSPEEIARQEAAEQQRQAELVEAPRLKQAELAAKEDAWERFYQPSRACMYPESDQRKQVCEAAAQKAREKF